MRDDAEWDNNAGVYHACLERNYRELKPGEGARGVRWSITPAGRTALLADKIEQFTPAEFPPYLRPWLRWMVPSSRAVPDATGAP